jgi:hypothetical protein
MEFDALRLDVIGLGKALLDEAAERAQRVLGELQRMERQGVRLLFLTRPGKRRPPDAARPSREARTAAVPRCSR